MQAMSGCSPQLCVVLARGGFLFHFTSLTPAWRSSLHQPAIIRFGRALLILVLAVEPLLLFDSIRILKYLGLDLCEQACDSCRVRTANEGFQLLRWLWVGCLCESGDLELCAWHPISAWGYSHSFWVQWLNTVNLSKGVNVLNLSLKYTLFQDGSSLSAQRNWLNCFRVQILLVY